MLNRITKAGSKKLFVNIVLKHIINCRIPSGTGIFRHLNCVHLGKQIIKIMKRYLIFILLAAALVNNSSAQTSKDICSSKTLTSWNTKPASYTTVTEAKNMLADIIAVIGIKANFEIQSANVDNAAAVIYGSKRYILYNPDFINRLNTAAGNNWASISILAHEIGHHLNGHTLENIGSQPDKELEADEFSGFVLRRMGATLAEAQTAMKIAADYKASLTHPGKEARLVAIANGWNTANQQQSGKDLAKTMPVKTAKQNDIYKTNNDQAEEKNDQQTTMQTGQRNVRTQPDDNNVTRYPVTRTSNPDKQTGVANSYILADINFSADQSTAYQLTAKYNVVKVMNNQLYIIGKMTANNNKDYPYIISDDAGTTLWVDDNGYIINANNKRVGFLKVRSRT